MNSIVKVFAQSSFSQGIQFFDDPTGLSGFAVPVADLADVLELEVKGLIGLISDEYLCLSPKQADLLLVIEYGVYEALSRTRSKVAKPFQSWLVKEVIPSIRKTGGYGQPQQQLTPSQKKLIELSTGHRDLQEALVNQCLVYHTPKLLPQVNEPVSLAATEHEYRTTGIIRDCTDNFMLNLLEEECLRQVAENGEIRTGIVWATINEGRPDDPNERRTVKWVQAKIDRLLPHWNMDWINPKTKAKAVHWALSAGL